MKCFVISDKNTANIVFEKQIWDAACVNIDGNNKMIERFDDLCRFD